MDLEPVFERLAGLAPSILYVFDLGRMSNVWANRSLFGYLGYRDSDIQQMGANFLPELMHPDDFQRYEAHFQRLMALKDGDRAQFEYRMRHRNGNWVWLHSHEAVNDRGPDGAVTQIVGSAHDITAIKEASEQIELVSKELRHRVSNIFALTDAMISMTARNHPDVSKVLSDLSGRVSALASAQDIYLSSGLDEDVPVQPLLNKVLSPFYGNTQIEVTCEELNIPGIAATSFGMILHELTTNAVKYGALRSHEGSLKVTVRQTDGQLTLSWVEQLVPEPGMGYTSELQEGFGSKLIDLSARQMGGQFHRQIDATEMVARLVIPNP